MQESYLVSLKLWHWCIYFRWLWSRPVYALWFSHNSRLQMHSFPSEVKKRIWNKMDYRTLEQFFYFSCDLFSHLWNEHTLLHRAVVRSEWVKVCLMLGFRYLSKSVINIGRIFLSPKSELLLTPRYMITELQTLWFAAYRQQQHW
jgi:hypothetical protein